MKDINLTEIDEDIATPLIEMSGNILNRKLTISVAESESMNDNDYNDALEELELGNSKSNISLQPKISRDTDTVVSNDDVPYLHNKYESFAL